MRKFIAVAVTAVAFAGCYADKYEELYPLGSVVCDTTTVTYTADIKPIFQSNCNTSSCHGAGTTSGFDFSTHAAILVEAQNGKLLGSINWTSGFSAMPQNLPKLAQCDIDKITRWVNQGAPNN